MNGMTQNHMAVELLKLTGFPLPNIRLSLHKLTGITQPKIVEKIGTNLGKSSQINAFLRPILFRFF